MNEKKAMKAYKALRDMESAADLKSMMVGFATSASQSSKRRASNFIL